jgi:ribose transport system substrate-binding protein
MTCTTAPTRRRARALIAGLLALAMLATACSDDDESSSSTDDSTEDGGGGGIAEAQEIVEAALQRPTEIEVSEPIGEPIPEDVTVAWIQCSIPACTQLGEALQEGTDALGWQLDIIDGGITPESIKAAWAEAVRTEPDAVVASGFPRVVFEEELQALAELEIPVVDINVTDPAEDGITAVVQGAETYGPNGALQADYVLADAGEDANTLFVTTSAFPVVGVRTEGFQAEYERLCPDCELDVLEADPADFGDALVTQIVAELQANPDINHVVAGVSDMVTGLTGALAGAGLDEQVTVSSHDINPALAEDISSGSALQATVMMENVDMMWLALDVLVRQLLGQDIETSVGTEPNMWIVDEDNIEGFDEPYPVVEDYQAQYEELWGI